MEILNARSLVDVMNHCRDYPGYQAVVVINNRSRLREFTSGMRTYLRDDGSDDVTSISRAGIIKFKNGSYIRPITADSGARGVSAHEIIYDDGLEDADIAARIRKIIYHCHEEESEPVTLDDFLSEFKIL